MGFYIRQTKKVAPRVRANVSKSGVSLSTKVGPVTLNTRGRGTVRLGKGFGFKF